jgi:hypothetical protein
MTVDPDPAALSVESDARIRLHARLGLEKYSTA